MAFSLPPNTRPHNHDFNNAFNTVFNYAQYPLTAAMRFIKSISYHIMLFIPYIYIYI